MASLISIAVALAKLGFKKSTAITAASINALGLPAPWNPVTNVATLLGGAGTTSLAANAAPVGDNSFYASVGGTLLVPLTLAAGGNLTTVNANDIVYWTGNGWAVLFASANGTVGKLPLKGDGAGGIANAVLGVDVAPGPLLQTTLPVGSLPPCTVGPNGFVTLPSAYVFATALTYYYYSKPGAYLYYQAGVIDKTLPAGFYFTVMGLTGVMNGTLTNAGTGYTNGTYTNVPLTGGAGTLALANITVAGGVVTQVVITHQGTGYAINDALSCSAANVGGTGTGFVFTVSLLSAYNTTTGLATLTITTAGTGYTNGTYTNVPLTNISGAGVAAQATITVQGGVVVAAQVTIQGSGYSATGGSNQVTAAVANLGGGAGSGLVLTVATIGAGPMTGIVYNNMYVPGTNTGAWTTSNLSLQVPATLTPFVGTQGGAGGTATYNANQLTLTATKLPANYLGNNGRVNFDTMHSYMNTTTATKVLGVGLATTLAGSATLLSASTFVTNSLRQGLVGIFLNRSKNLQWAPNGDPVAAGNSSLTSSSVDTSVDSWIKSVTYLNNSSGAYTSPGVLNGGSGYTNGTYTNVAITGGNGTGMTANITVAGGVVTSFTITNAGTGYLANNTLSASTATIGAGTGFTYVLNGGAITGGSGYTNGVYANVPLTGGAGTGAVATITVTAGAVSNVVVTQPGTGYAATNALTASTTFLGAGTGFVYTLGTALTMADWSVQEFLVLNVTPQP